MAAVAAGLALSPELRTLAEGAFGELTWGAVLATVPAQIAATLLCAAALQVLGPGVSFGASVLSRVLRDAGGNLLVVVPGLGELIGGRALVLAGGTARAAVAASALDVLAESVAQVPFVLLALAVLPRLVGRPRLDRGALAWGGIGLIAAILFGLVIWWTVRRPGAAVLAGVLRRRWAEAGAAWRRRSGAMPAAIGIHFAAWFMGGLQVWLAARALGMPLGLVGAIVLESAGYAVRAILFFVPAGVGVQEGGFIVAGLALGLGREQALALSLTLRARDVLLGVPVLALWPVIEWRTGRRVTTR